jgi:predicted TIM-barrel fold metal-dependent hydrolase
MLYLARKDRPMERTEYIEFVHRELPYSTFDADNHLYETRDALTKFLPPEYEGVVKYVEVDGRTKLALKDRISDYIPNPTFAKVAVPGGAGFDVTKGGTGFPTGIHVLQKKMVAMPGIDAFFEPQPRLELMKEMGIDRTLLWPTLASALEERLADDPDAVCAVIHALNQWMHEHWSFVYADAIFAAPIISLAVLDRALDELEFVAERGAKLFLIRVAPVPTWQGRKSFALPEFDPFWERVCELGLVVGMHSGDPGYTRYLNEWEGISGEYSISRHARRANPVFVALSSEKDNLVDALASIIGHGLATRFPRLKFLPVEYSSRWIRPFFERLQRTWADAPALFDENPVEIFTRNVWVHAFHEPDPKGLIDVGIPVDHIMFGSDFPHPEGMGDPLSYSEVVRDLPLEQQALIMGGALEKVMRVGAYA